MSERKLVVRRYANVEEAIQCGQFYWCQDDDGKIDDPFNGGPVGSLWAAAPTLDGVAGLPGSVEVSLADALKFGAVDDLVDGVEKSLAFVRYTLEFFGWSAFPNLEAEVARLRSQLTAALAKAGTGGECEWPTSGSPDHVVILACISDDFAAFVGTESGCRAWAAANLASVEAAAAIAGAIQVNLGRDYSMFSHAFLARVEPGMCHCVETLIGDNEE
jgi:hypothetical protein